MSKCSFITNKQDNKYIILVNPIFTAQTRKNPAQRFNNNIINVQHSDVKIPTSSNNFVSYRIAWFLLYTWCFLGILGKYKEKKLKKKNILPFSFDLNKIWFIPAAAKDFVEHSLVDQTLNLQNLVIPIEVLHHPQSINLHLR